MDNLVIYVKSYRNDIDKIKVLLDSTYKHNVDNMPIYVSCPKQDLEIFKSKLGTSNYTLIADEDIIEVNGMEGWKSQQIVKSQFWKLNLCKNYFIIDSDGQFIKDIRKSDLMYNEEIPYTVCHEYKELFEFVDKHPLPFDPYKSFIDERRIVMDLFGRGDGLVYDFGPIPLVWNRVVWETLEKEYLEPNKLTFIDLINHTPSEFTWYGEWFLYRKPIELHPRGPIFKSYHFRHQYEEDKKIGYNIEKMKKLYYGVMLNTNWGAPLQF
jgi:hypothetical protein